MQDKKNIFTLVGSAADNSSNLQLVNYITALAPGHLSFILYNKLHELPHFNPALSLENTPEIILDLRRQIEAADAVFICTPEYIFSIPSALKNLFEWCVATTIFSNKPSGLITASAHGTKGHEELKLIMKTIEASFTPETTLLIQGIKGKVDDNGVKDMVTKDAILQWLAAFESLIMSNRHE